ncbi:LysR substrate-binding domain-containing protein [Cysteiniphilum litorale]|uniref:LysR substrate-binding domain-containing protein n=1 Tax=Cysteiniphilum litorale TaxID=2056700 RepID=UPI003F88480B
MSNFIVYSGTKSSNLKSKCCLEWKIMNIRDLEYIIAVAKHKNFNKAAQDCFVSQPALSMQIKKLEDELGVAIFERFQKSVLVTAIGQQIIDKAQSLLTIVQDIKDLAATHNKTEDLLFRIGLFPTLAHYLLPQLIHTTLADKSPIKIYPIEEKSPILIQMLQSGKIDAALLAYDSLPQGLEFLPLFKDTFKLAVYDGHPLSQLPEVDISKLDDEAMLFLEKGHCLREQVLSLNINPAQSIQCNATGLETLRQMVIAKLGITIIPEIATLTSHNGIHYIDFKAPAPFREIGLVYRRGSAITKWLKAIELLVKKSVPSLASH